MLKRTHEQQRKTISRRARHLTRLIILSALLLPIVSMRSGAVAAATPTTYMFTVNTTADTHDAHPGDGKCADKKGKCSLRAAIEEADALPSSSSITISVPAGTYRLSLGTLSLTANTISIKGAGNKTTIISGNQTFGIMRITGHTSASLSQLALRGGYGRYGGAINNSGMLSVSHSILSGNTATFGDGGGIVNSGTLSVSASTISGNSTFAFGGGIDNDSGGTLTVTNSTLGGNMADVGGGISNDSGGMLTVTNSTISGNNTSDAGGIYNGGTMSMSNSTISGNSASDGGGIYDYYGTVTVTNSTIAGNSYNQGAGISFYNAGGGSVTLTATIIANSPGNCYGPITDGGYNLESDSSCGFTNHALNNTNPQLGPLRHNGGSTKTMALLKGSKAIDYVNNLNNCPSTDQRGYPRPDNNESACDIGAYESSY